jgi:membrane associated rhomboid family serine protease
MTKPARHHRLLLLHPRQVQGEVWRLATAAFVHSGALHLAGNMLAVHYLGPPVEHVTGRSLFTVVYLAGAVAGGAAHYMYGNPWASLLGSSGKQAGVGWCTACLLALHA